MTTGASRLRLRLRLMIDTGIRFGRHPARRTTRARLRARGLDVEMPYGALGYGRQVPVEIRRKPQADDLAAFAALCLGGLVPGGEIAASLLLAEDAQLAIQHPLTQNAE